MNIVVDVNLIASLILPLPYSQQTIARMSDWREQDIKLFAPTLLSYELSTILRRSVFRKSMTTDQAQTALEEMSLLGVEMVAPSNLIQERALHWAELLGQSKAYDAHYLSVAEAVNGNLWTADRRLSNAAAQKHIQWVRWIGETD